MKNKALVQDYLDRSRARLKALHTLMAEKSYADVAREAQEIVELCSKGILRANAIEPARVHDVSDQLEEMRQKLSASKGRDIEIVIEASRTLRRDRELAFYGGEDLTPSEFYREKDAKEALKFATDCVRIFGEYV